MDYMNNQTLTRAMHGKAIVYENVNRLKEYINIYILKGKTIIKFDGKEKNIISSLGKTKKYSIFGGNFMV